MHVLCCVVFYNVLGIAKGMVSDNSMPFVITKMLCYLIAMLILV